MARPSLASVSDFEALLGEPVAAGSASRVALLLAHASEIVRVYAGATWLNDDEDDLEDLPAQIPMVVCMMVERATSNPLGVTQETAGPFSRSFGSDAAQRLYMTRQERAIVRAAAGVAAVAPLGTTRGDLETRQMTSVWTDAPQEETDPFGMIED